MKNLELRKIGNSLGVLLPRAIQERLHVAEGDTLYLTNTPDGVRITAHDPGFAEAMEALADRRVAGAGALVRPYEDSAQQLDAIQLIDVVRA